MTLSEIEEDLKATCDDIKADALRLAAIEGQKATLDIDDPRMTDLSAEAQQIADGLVPKTAIEAGLVDEASATS